MNYKIIKGLDNFYLLENDWCRLLKKIPFYFPTNTFLWLKSWINAHWNDIEEIYCIVVRDNLGHIISIIPLYSYKAKIFFWQIRTLSLMGGRDQMMTDILVIPEHRQAVTNLLIKIVQKDIAIWEILSFRRLNNSQGDTIYLGRVLHKNDVLHSSESLVKIPFLYLEGDWQNYYAARKKRFKKEIRRKIKKLNERGIIRYEVVGSPFPAKQLEKFFKLEDKGWKGENGSSILRRPHLHKLYTALASADTEFLRMLNFNLYLDDLLISSSICFKTKSGLYVFKITYEEELAKCSPGLLLRLYELEYAYQQGLKIYDFSGPEQRWMHFFTDRFHFSLDIIVYRKNILPFVRYLGYTKIKQNLKYWPKLENFLKRKIKE